MANNDDLRDLQASLPDGYKWVGLATVSVCNGIRIKPPKIPCPQMRDYFHQITGEYPEDMLIDPLPIDADPKGFLKQRYNVCTGLDLSGLDCEQIIDITARLSSVSMPGVGRLLASPLARSVVKSIFCNLNIDITLPDIDISFPGIDFGFGSDCWFGCGGDDDDSSDGGDDGDDGSSGGDGGQSGGPPYWFPDPNGSAPYDCSLVSAELENDDLE